MISEIEVLTMLQDKLRKLFHQLRQADSGISWASSGRNTAKRFIMMDMNGLISSNIVKKYSFLFLSVILIA